MRLATRRRRRRVRDDRGAVLVEFIFVFPLLWMVLTGIIEFGWWIHINNVVDQAARAGARTAAIDGASSDDVTQAVRDAIEGGGLHTDLVDIEVRFGGVLVDGGTDLELTCVLEDSELIQVRVLYDNEPLMPSSRSPLFGGFGNIIAGVDAEATLPAETYWRPGASGPQLTTGPTVCP
jgi:Flp pilus assembly protein TadG